MNLPVTIIGVGAGFAYGSDGPTHHATKDIAIMRMLPEINILNPSDSVMAAASVRMAYKSSSPTYVRIDKGKFPLIYDAKNTDFSDGITKLRNGNNLTIISTGFMVHRALEAAEALLAHSISCSIIDLYRIKPLNTHLLLKMIGNPDCIVTLEENEISGGIGSILTEVLSDNMKSIPLKRVAILDQHCFEAGDRESLHALYRLDTDSIVKILLDWYPKIHKRN